MSKKKAEPSDRRIGFQINLSPDEKEAISTAAAKEGLPIATYIRTKALAVAVADNAET